MSFSFPSKCAKPELTRCAMINAGARGDEIKQMDVFLFPTRLPIAVVDLQSLS